MAGEFPSFLTSSWTDVEKFFGINGQTTALNPDIPASRSAARMQNVGLLTSVFGGVTSAIGSFYAAKSQQYQDQSQASTLDFQSGIDAINAHSEELSAQSTLEASKTQVQQYTMRAGQQQAAATTATAARGVDLSSGSAVAERASESLVKDIDVYTIDSNATRAEWSARTQSVNDMNQSNLARVSAGNLRASAASISPGLALSTSLLSSATSIASKWDYRRQLALSTGGGMQMPWGASY